MNWLKKISSITFYHGSRKNLPIGTILTPQTDGYVFDQEWDVADIEKAMEKYRPSDKISRKESIFMVDNPDLIDSAGGYLDYIYIVQPIGKVEKSDLDWYSNVQEWVFTNTTEAQQKVKQSSMNYWNGVSSGKGSLFEYRARSAKIIGIDPGSEMIDEYQSGNLSAI